MMNKRDIETMANGILYPLYEGNFEATEQLVELMDRIAKEPLITREDYVQMYEDHLYTFPTWEELLASEVEQGSFGLSEEECLEQLDKTIWRLPCGWYVQYVYV